MDSAASTAPPPVTTDLDSRTRLTTQRASCSERSISSHMKSLAPRRMMEADVRALVLGGGRERRGQSTGCSRYVDPKGIALNSYFLTRMSSSSHTRSCTTSSAWPSIVASNVSSPSRLVRDGQTVAGKPHNETTR